MFRIIYLLGFSLMVIGLFDGGGVVNSFLMSFRVIFFLYSNFVSWRVILFFKLIRLNIERSVFWVEKKNLLYEVVENIFD